MAWAGGVRQDPGHAAVAAVAAVPHCVLQVRPRGGDGGPRLPPAARHPAQGGAGEGRTVSISSQGNI